MKSLNKRAIKAIKGLESALAAMESVTDAVVEIDAATGSDDMQTSEWQNFQYLVDCCKSHLEDSTHLLDDFKE